MKNVAAGRVAAILSLVTSFCALFALSPVFGSPGTIPVPAVDGLVVDTDGGPVEYALVAVTFMGTHGSVNDQDCDVVKLGLVHGMTDGQGRFHVPSETVRLADLEGKSVDFIGARVQVSREGFEEQDFAIGNLAVGFGGKVSIFLLGAIEHGSGLFSAISAGFAAVKAAGFIPQYRRLLESSPIVLQKKGSGTTGRRGLAFPAAGTLVVRNGKLVLSEQATAGARPPVQAPAPSVRDRKAFDALYGER